MDNELAEVQLRLFFIMLITIPGRRKMKLKSTSSFQVKLVDIHLRLGVNLNNLSRTKKRLKFFIAHNDIIGELLLPTQTFTCKKVFLSRTWRRTVELLYLMMHLIISEFEFSALNFLLLFYFTFTVKSA